MVVLGMMMNRPLRVADILTYAEEVHPDAEIVSATVEGGLHRTTYAETGVRIRRLARALQRKGIAPGDRVATLAWNGYRHFELYYAISGIGAVCHTINPRLSADQMAYIVGHAEDTALFVDLTFVPLVEKLLDRLPAGITYVVMTDRAHMPETQLPGALCYEELLAGEDADLIWPEFPEETASGLCYTSGTTGNPKGVLFTHRSTLMHAFACGVAFQNSLRPGARVLPVVPLFHVNAWGLPYSAPLTGASIVFPGPALDGASLFDLMDGERVLSAWGVPTVWLGLLAEMRQREAVPAGFQEVIIGGSSAPRSMVEAFEDSGVRVSHAWGMTEMNPVGTQGGLTGKLAELPREERYDLQARHGRRLFGVEMKLLDENGALLPNDGQAVGELYVRGNTVTSGYYADEAATAGAFDADGWFGTGDIATIDGQGFLTITDRAKDLIKSGGEWISSVELENTAISHPGVANCAVIAVPHSQWGERPLLVVVPAEGEHPGKQELIDLLAGHFAKWQLPDDVVYADALPLTATGKISKLRLRQTYAGHPLPTAAS